MPGIIKADTPHAERPAVGVVAFNFDDVAGKANAYLQEVKAEAARLLAQAEQEAVQLRQQAREQGAKDALAQAEKSTHARVEALVHKQMQTVLPAIEQVAAALAAERQQWLAVWERSAIQLAIAIAEKIVRHELISRPEIPLTLAREALELAGGSQSIKIGLHPGDHAALGKQVEELARRLAPMAAVTIQPDPEVSAGGCRLRTEHGEIDQRLETQLARIAEELC